MSSPPGESMDQGRPQVEIDFFRPQDAPGVAVCMRAVYGEAYPVKTYYHPQRLIAAVEAGEIICIVARDHGGQVVGVVNFFNMAPFKGIYEIGAGLVLPAYRQRGLNTDMITFMLEKAVPLRKVPVGFGESVCSHTYLQKTQEARGYVHTALEVDLMPAEAYGAQQDAGGRVSVMAGFKVYQPRPHAVHLPPRYASLLRELYDGTGQERQFLEADSNAQARGESELTVQVFDFAQAARVAVHQIGADLEGRLDELLAQLQGRGVVVAQMWLKLASPLVAAAVEALRSRGFFLGGLLPRWFDHDGLLMQRVFAPPNWRGIQAYSARGRRIVEMVRNDWLGLGQGRP